MDVQAFRSQIVVSLALLFLIYSTQCTTNITIRPICRGPVNYLTDGFWIESHYKSHVKLDLAYEPVINNLSEFRLSFDFRTNSTDGILFYGRTSNAQELIALTLQGGDLVYKIRCSYMHADVLVRTQNHSLLNDSTWHTITYSLGYESIPRGGRIEIDGQSSNTTTGQYLVSCGNVTNITMGGHRRDDRTFIYGLENLPGHFEGCMKNVILPVALNELPKYSLVSMCE